MILFYQLLLGHFVADFSLQSDSKKFAGILQPLLRLRMETSTTSRPFHVFAIYETLGLPTEPTTE